MLLESLNIPLMYMLNVSDTLKAMTVLEYKFNRILKVHYTALQQHWFRVFV